MSLDLYRQLRHLVLLPWRMRLRLHSRVLELRPVTKATPEVMGPDLLVVDVDFKVNWSASAHLKGAREISHHIIQFYY